MTVKPVPSYLYACRSVDDDGPVKIGCSVSPVDRLKMLMDWSPSPLKLLFIVPGGLLDERAVHSVLIEHHSHHEWFHPHPEVLGLIGEIKSGATDPRSLPRVSLKSMAKMRVVSDRKATA